MTAIVDEEWETFLNDDIYEELSERSMNEEQENICSIDLENPPKCGDIYISTKTKITYLNINNIDIAELFWAIPIMPYINESNGIIKKQIKITCDTKDKYDEIMEKSNEHIGIQINKIMRKNKKSVVLSDKETKQDAKKEECISINKKNKYICKVNVGISNKDILSYRIKNKGAFYNCLVMIFRIKYEDEYREVNVKLFNTGKLSFPGMLLNKMLEDTIIELIKTLQPHYPNFKIECLDNKADTVLINSNFNCGYYIDRDKLFKILRYDYGLHCEYDPCKYPGIRCIYFENKKYPDAKGICKCSKSCANKRKIDTIDNCKGIAFMIFRTGSILIVGNCDEDLLYEIYGFLKEILNSVYKDVAIGNISERKIKNNNKKYKKKTIYVKSPSY